VAGAAIAAPGGGGGDGGRRPASAGGGAAGGFASPLAETAEAPEKLYDAFLSHKQSDAKDFVRALHTGLTLRGFDAFLDMEVGRSDQGWSRGGAHDAAIAPRCSLLSRRDERPRAATR
jgi:hypothetical protein